MLRGIGSAENAPGHHFHREPKFPYWTLAVLWRGRGRFILPTGTADIATGSIIRLRPHTPYRIEQPGGGSESWAFFTPPPAWESLLTWPEELPGLAIISPGGAHDELAKAAFREASTWWQAGQPQAELLALNALERCLLLLNLDRPGTAWAELHPAIRAAINILAPGPAKSLSVISLAQRVGCSPSHFAHLFTQQIGESPLSWLEGRRLARAQQLLLTTDWSAKRIATECGFANGEHLSRRFRRRFHLSPGAWRRQELTGP